MTYTQSNEDEEDEEETGDANPAYDEDEDTVIEPVYSDDFTPWWDTSNE